MTLLISKLKTKSEQEEPAAQSPEHSLPKFQKKMSQPTPQIQAPIERPAIGIAPQRESCSKQSDEQKQQALEAAFQGMTDEEKIRFSIFIEYLITK